MNRAERLSGILEMLAQRGSVEVDELVNALDVSPATVRRDLQRLDGRGMLERTHGGAVAIGGLYELPLRYRSALHREKKLRIARAAAEHVPEGATVGMTGGTTTSEVSRMLIRYDNLTVVTNAINIAAELAVRPNIRVIVTGGVAQASYELVGPLADDTLSQLNVEIAFIGVDGIGATTGLTTHREVEARTNRLLVERAKQVIVVAHDAKVGTAALARICDIGAIDRLITTEGADHDELRAIEAKGVEVETV